MKYPFLAVGLAVLCAAGCQKKEADVPAASSEAAAASEAGFEFTASKKGLEIVFKGVKGTQWKEATHTCKAVPCEFVLDSAGVNTNMPVSGFGIAFRLDAKKVEMASAAGASWNTLSYTCESGQCEFKVDDKGVAGI